MKNLTIYYVVGGAQNNYDNLQRALQKLKLLNFEGQVVILEVGNKLKSEKNITVINEPNLIDFNKLGKIGYKFWELKYYAAKYMDTEYVVYMDTDTIVVNNIFNELFEEIGDNIGVAQHFYVPTISDFKQKCMTKEALFYFDAGYNTICDNHSIDHYLFFAGGIFLCKNTIKNIGTLKYMYNIYSNFNARSNKYIPGITDELFFSALLNEGGNYTNLGGALNHCVMEDMPLKYEDGIFYGKNPYEQEWKKVLAFHCDPSRREPGFGVYRNKINQEFLL